MPADFDLSFMSLVLFCVSYRGFCPLFRVSCISVHGPGHDDSGGSRGWPYFLRVDLPLWSHAGSLIPDSHTQIQHAEMDIVSEIRFPGGNGFSSPLFIR